MVFTLKTFKSYKHFSTNLFDTYVNELHATVVLSISSNISTKLKTKVYKTKEDMKSKIILNTDRAIGRLVIKMFNKVKAYDCSLRSG